MKRTPFVIMLTARPLRGPTGPALEDRCEERLIAGFKIGVDVERLGVIQLGHEPAHAHFAVKMLDERHIEGMGVGHAVDFAEHDEARLVERVREGEAALLRLEVEDHVVRLQVRPIGAGADIIDEDRRPRQAEHQGDDRDDREGDPLQNSQHGGLPACCLRVNRAAVFVIPSENAPTVPAFQHSKLTVIKASSTTPAGFFRWGRLSPHQSR